MHAPTLFLRLLCILGSAVVLGGLAPAQELNWCQFGRQQLTDIYYSEGVSIGDINGDGHNDLVYGPYWFAGPDFKERSEIYAAQPQPMDRYADNFFSWIHDFDGDGANDVFVVGFPGTPAYVYQNPGKGEGQWAKYEVFDWVSNESPRLVDLLGDDTPELVCTRDGFFGFATIDPARPLSSWTFHPISEKITAEKFGHGLGIGDVNSDGRNDILHKDGWFEQPAQGAFDGRWKNHRAQFSSAYGGAEMYAYDVDGDGDNDIITSEAAHDFGLSWYEQTAPDTFQRHVIMGTHPSENKYGFLFTELHSVNLADMDGDGLKDIVTGKTYWSHHRQSPMWDAGAVVVWFKLVRSAEGVDWLPFEADGKSGIGRQLVVSDINQDGWPDIAAGGMLGANILIQDRQSVTQEQFNAAKPKLVQGAALPSIENAIAMRGRRSPMAARGQVAGAIEGEDLNASVTGGSARVQPMGNFSGDRWSGDSQLWWTGGKPGDQLTLELDALRDIEAFELALTCARDYGIVDVKLNGESLGQPIDLYHPEVITTGLLEFTTPDLKAGKHKLTFEILGANSKAVKSYMLGLDFVRFRAPDQVFPEPGFRPTAEDGRELNLGFETGTLDDWIVQGSAFDGQPIQGDAVHARRNDMFSRHAGRYWIGGYEKLQDSPTGTLTSVPFRVSARFATFLVGGGSSPATRVELVAVGEEKPFYTMSGKNSEDLELVVVDLRRVEGREMVIRLVDESRGGWGHINFDDFRLHLERPGESTPASVPLEDDEYPHRGLAAEQAAAAMQVPEGFEVTVCAAEPDVKQPIAMAIDDRGRTWIAEAYEYPQCAEGDQGRDRILVFEDTTGDGRFDSRKIFAEGLNLVSGLEVGFGGVWVGAAPYLMFIPDANGDDVPDGDPQILLDGWGYHDTHETLNAFCWGPDGWLYGCHGVFTHSKVGKPGTPEAERTPINAGIWRYHPTRHEFEVFAHGTSNPWGVDFNEHGEAFATACVIPHLYHIIPGARYQRQAGQHFNTNTYDDIRTIADHLHYLGATPHSGNGKSDEVGGGHAHAGAMIYQGGAWPAEYQGALFMNNIHGQRLNMDLLMPKGSGYVGTHGPDFLKTGDMASQILNMRYGPDGQVTMIDWYDMQACHRREVEVHDRSNGRVYKISYRGGERESDSEQARVNLAELSDLELAELCLNTNDWYVRHARRLLQERAAKAQIDAAAVNRLFDIATSHPDDTRRLRASWAHHVVQPFGSRMVGQLLQDASPHVRGWTVRLVAEQMQYRLDGQMLDRLAAMSARDDSPVVRLAIASVANRLPLSARWDIVEALAMHAEDVADHNLPLMVWYVMEPLANEDPDRALAVAIKAGETIPLLREFMLRRLGGTGSVEALNRLVAGLNVAQTPELQLTYLTAIRNAIRGQRRVQPPAGWERLKMKLDGAGDETVRRAAIGLALTFGDESAANELEKSLVDSHSSDDIRLHALESLLAARHPGLDRVLLDIAMGDEVSSELRQAAIRALAPYKNDQIGPALVDVYERLNASERRSAIATLCGRAGTARQLLDAIDAGRIAASDLTADFARQVEYLGDTHVSKQLADVWGQVRESSADKTDVMRAYKKLIANESLPKPDLAFGRAIFAKTCQRCHQLYGVGQNLGPELTGSNRANIDYLLENIVDPSAVMAREYRQSIFLTEDDQLITGIVREENERAVTLQTADAIIVLPQTEIAERKVSEQSMMPENQLSQFSEHEIRSLIAYLRHDSQTPIRATRDNASLLFNGKDLVGWSGDEALWSVENGELVGKSKGLTENAFLVSDFAAGDFSLKLEIKLVENLGNSGIQFRSQALASGSVSGYQADVGEGWWGKLYEEHGRGLLWDQSGEQFVKLGDWNTYEIEAVGSKIRTRINGHECVNLDDPQGADRGVFALQLHSGGPTEVRFRNLRLEVLDNN